MSRMDSRTFRLLAAMVVLAVSGVACGGGKGEAAPPPPPTETTLPPVPTGPDTVAAQLRTTFDGLLQEHVALTAAATNASAGGRGDEMAAATRHLGANSDALIASVGTVFGSQAGTTFDPLWKKHGQLFLSYAQGQGQAISDLAGSDKELGTFFNSQLPDLPADSVTELLRQHVTSLRSVIDAQRAGDETRAYSNMRTAMADMSPLAEALAAATAAKFPEKVSGNPKSPAATLVVTLNGGLREHVYLLAATTGAALAGRKDEVTGASASLDANSNALAGLIASVFGPEAGKAFDPLWKRHIALFMDYAAGQAADDKGKQDKAVTDLLAYTDAFATFLNSASPALPTDVVAELIKTHVLTQKDVIDTQKVKNFPAAFGNIRVAAEHMSTVAEQVGGAIVKQFPQKF